MRLDLLPAPAQQAAGRQLGLAGFRILQQLARPADGADPLRTDADPDHPAAEPDPPPEPETASEPDATELLMQDEQRQAPGSHADQRARQRQVRDDDYLRQQASFRHELRAAHHAGRQSGGAPAPRGGAPVATPVDTPGASGEESPRPGAPRTATQPNATSEPTPRANEPARGGALPQPPVARDLPPALPATRPTASAEALPKDVNVQRTSASRPPGPRPTAPVAAAATTPRARGPQRPAPQPDAPRPTALRETTTTGDKAVTAAAGAPRDPQHDSGNDARQPQQQAVPKPAAAGPVVTAQASEPLDPADRAQNLERIVRVVQAEAQSGNSRVVLQLSPPELGNLRMQLNLRRGQLDVSVRAETELARSLLTGGTDTLRSGLQRAGLELVNFDVQPATPPTGVPVEAAAGRVAALPDRRPASEDPGEAGAAETRDPVAEPRLNVLA